MALQMDPKQTRIVMIAAPLLLAAAVWYVDYKPRGEQITRAQARLDQLETRNASARVLAQRGGPELESRLAIYEQHMERLEQLIPNREEVPGLLNSVTLRAQDAGVELSQYRPGGEERGDHYNRQFYEISVVGSYHDVGEFLAEIGSLPRIITPLYVRMTRHGSTRQDGAELLLASFRIETYVLPEPFETTEETAQ